MEKDIEAFVCRQICSNRGTDNVVMKTALIDLAERYHISVTPKMTKEEIYLQLREQLYLKDILAVCNIGVKSIDVQQLFGITHRELKKLEESGFLRVSGKRRFCAYGRNIYVPLYDAIQVYSLTPEAVHDELKRLSKRKV